MLADPSKVSKMKLKGEEAFSLNSKLESVIIINLSSI